MKKTNNTAVAVVADAKYLIRYLFKFLTMLTSKGNYKGDVVIVTNFNFITLLLQLLAHIKFKNLHFYRFKKIKFNKKTAEVFKNLDFGDNPNRFIHKSFQWHKLYLFQKKLKKWRYIFYLDINMNIHSDINPILNNFPSQSLFANCDNFENQKITLESQFDKTNPLYESLNKKFDMKMQNYFQTGMLFFDTNIISENTIKDILKIVEKYPISVTNEQGILNLYFHFIKNQYKNFEFRTNNIINYSYWKLKNEKSRITKQLKHKIK